MDYGYSEGYASFSGTYSANDSYFVFSYDYLLTGPFMFNITITDLTTSANLFSQNISSPKDEAGTYYIATPIGNNIGVDFSLILNRTHWDGWATSTVGYSMNTAPVVPEPISFILFLTGGLTLFGSRYLKRKKRYKD